MVASGGCCREETGGGGVRGVGWVILGGGFGGVVFWVGLILESI